MREPLLKLLGDKYFSTFRAATQVSDKIRIIDDSFVIVSGCHPRDCWDNFAMFIIDVRRKLAWAVKGEEVPVGHRSALIWGVIGKKNELLLREIGRWLKDNKIPPDSITHVSLSPSVSELYALHNVNHHVTAPSKDAGKVAIVLNSDGPQHKVLATVELFNLLASSIYVVNATRIYGDEFQGVSGCDLIYGTTYKLSRCD